MYAPARNCEAHMPIETVVAIVFAFAALIYLLYALLRPEKL
jgi:K+-transporting ATPase KdpF subunit